jgi:hypothetical protein
MLDHMHAISLGFDYKATRRKMLKVRLRFELAQMRPVVSAYDSPESHDT